VEQLDAESQQVIHEESAFAEMFREDANNV
jgi:hypothetical protein